MSNKPKCMKSKGIKVNNQTDNLNWLKIEKKERVCPLCGTTYFGYGNNPRPLNIKRVCDNCNTNVIIPMRLREFYSQKRG